MVLLRHNICSENCSSQLYDNISKLPYLEKWFGGRVKMVQQYFDIGECNKTGDLGQPSILVLLL